MTAVRRTVGVLAIALLVAAGCVVAGVWQWGRHADRSAAAALVDANYDAAPVPIADVVALDEDLAAGLAWHPVTIIGRYLPDASVLLRGRPVSGRPAVHALELLEVDQGPLTGTLLVVNRGWIALSPDAGLPDVPGPPRGTVEVVVRLRPSDPPSGWSAPEGQVRAIAVEQVRAASDAPADGETLPCYGVLVTEDGSPPNGLAPQPRPEIRLGVNLSYAFQWWLFALGALAGGVVLSRTRPGAPGDRTPLASRTAPSSRRRHGRTAEEEEDALLDAQVVPPTDPETEAG